MYPTNHYMDPYYPYCRDHPPYPYYPPPAWEAGHRQMAMDSSCRPPSYGSVPYSGSTSHSHLPESHSCCNKTCPPGYYSFRSPFSQELPPPHLYYHGPFPQHLNTCPSYFVPLQPYPVDQMPYGYGKFKGHCCGCPNHVCHGGEKSNLKIEEEMPEVKTDSEQKGADNSSIIGHPNYQYPAMCLPSGNMRDNVKGRSFEMPPQLFSKWFPESGEWTEDGKQQSHDNHNARKFQWPVIWMPRGYDEPKQETKEFKEVEQSPKVTKEAPHSPDVKIIPLSWFKNDHNDQKPVARDGSGEHNGRSSETNQSAGAERRHDVTVDRNFKTIPVAPAEPKNENKPAEKNYEAVVPGKEGDEKKVRTCRTIPVMVKKVNDEKASNVEEEGEHRKINNVETSKSKVSKLPPVCLRVDPLPRKKSGNKSSGSLNSATKKVCEKENDMKESQSKNQESKLSELNKENQNKESNLPVKEKSSEMDKRTGFRNVKVQDASVKPAQEKEISTKVDQKFQPSISVKPQENASAGSLQECVKSIEDEMKFQGETSKSACEINLSEPDAAICIQSAYRGYDVRRWKPLEKLRKVKKIHGQMQDLKKQLQALEASPKQLTVKEQVAINETIMNLLLNLDSIQGSHPSVREARKSVARELVCLQEKLDSLCKQLPSEPNNFRCEKEEPDRTDTDNAIQNTAHVSTAEASEEAKFTGVVEELGTSLINSLEIMNDELPYGIPKELRQDSGSTEQKHEMKESSTTHHEGKAVPPGECQGTPSMDVICDAAWSGHFTEQKHHMEESNTMSREELSENEKAAPKGEGHEASSVECTESSHDEHLSQESRTLEQCSASAEHDSCTEELNTRVSSPGATEDGIAAAMATVSKQSGASVDKDGAAEGQVWQSAALESSALKADATAATEDDENIETSVQFAQPCIHLKNAELHEHDPHLASVAFSLGDQPEEARGANLQNQVADTMQDSSAKEPDGTPVPTAGGTDSMDYVSTGMAEDSVPSPLSEETLPSDSALQQSCLQEPEAVKLCEVSYKDDSALVDQPDVARPENPEGGASIGEKHEVVLLENEAKTMGNTLLAVRDSGKEPDGTPEPRAGDANSMDYVSAAVSESSVRSPLLEETWQPDIGEKHEAVPSENDGMEDALHVTGVLSNMYAEPSIPEALGNESLCDQDGTMLHENPTESKVSLQSQSHSQSSGDKTCEEIKASEASECGEMLEETSARTTGQHRTELAADNPEEDAGIQMAPDEAATVTANNGDEKNLADENLKLKEMLQKLLSSGNDQMGIITELSEKVRTLERKLARKRRPKVRVRRPDRNCDGQPTLKDADR